MNLQVGKWGNSLGMRIPVALAKELGIRDGSELDLQQISGSLVLRPVVKAEVEYSLEEMLAQITPESLHGETDWGAPEGREAW
jgi:antitoxin MazE